MIRISNTTLALVIALAMCAPQAGAGTADNWLVQIGPVDLQSRTAIMIGAEPGYEDGYDGQPIVHTSTPGIYLALYRANSDTWAGPTAFYADDPESPIAPGGSHTWSDIYLWSQDYTPTLGDRVRTICDKAIKAPTGWWAQLVLDYTPASMNWTGETEWWFPLDRMAYGVPNLPCPITDDPFNPDNVTRMHLTVYTYPVPEPSSLAALGLALTTFGAGFLRRRRG